MPDYSGMTYVLVSKRTVTNPHALLNPKRQLCGREPALYPDIRAHLRLASKSVLSKDTQRAL